MSTENTDHNTGSSTNLNSQASLDSDRPKLKSKFYLSLEDIKNKGTLRRTSGEGDPLITPKKRPFSTNTSPVHLSHKRPVAFQTGGNAKLVVVAASQKLLDAAYGPSIRSPVIQRTKNRPDSRTPGQSSVLENEGDYFNYGSTADYERDYSERSLVNLNGSTHSHLEKLTPGGKNKLSQTLTSEDFLMLAPAISTHFLQSEANSIADGTAELNDAPIQRRFYDDFTSTDWVYDSEKLSNFKNNMEQIKGVRGRYVRLVESMKDWVLIAIVAVSFAGIAYIIDKCEFLLVDLRRGYCQTNWLSNEKFCCPFNDDKIFMRDTEFVCEDWIAWSSKFEAGGSRNLVELSIYIISSVVLAIISVSLTLTTKNDNPLIDEQPEHQGPAVEKKAQSHSSVIYSAAGSGVPEVKTILSGFVVRKFLGVYTLIIKSMALICGIASGLTIGKEGPYVHLASCVGNFCCRIFDRYNNNELVKRQILSAATSAGFALAFGSPLGGVLFSLEEITYYITGSQLFKIFFCAIVSILALQFLDPYGTGKTVMFEITYSSDWKPTELIYFIIIGVVGGIHGAFFCRFAAIWWPRWFRSKKFINKKYVKEVVLVTLATSLITFFNPYTRQPIPELLHDLAKPCDYKNHKISILCPKDFQEFPKEVITLMFAFLIKLVFTAITYGLKVPSGIYVPSMALGATFGRSFAMIIQYLQVHYPQYFISPEDCLIANGGPCIDFGIYAMIGAGAFMAGITRMNVTLATTLFEITASYTYVLPISISVAVANWVANSIEPNSLYELLIINHNFPFMRSTQIIGFSNENTVIDMVEYNCIDQEDKLEIEPGGKGTTTMSELRIQLQKLQNRGLIDGCLPIVSEGVLLGVIPAPELEFYLDKLREFCSEYGIKNEVLCKILPENCGEELYMEFSSSIASSRQLLASEILNELTDFSKILDTSPIQINASAKLSLVETIFKRVGNRSICILDKGKFWGVLHKKGFISYCRETKH